MLSSIEYNGSELQVVEKHSISLSHIYPVTNQPKK